MTCIGKYRHRIQVYEVEATEPDGIGGTDTVITPKGTFWARVQMQTGSRDNKNFNVTPIQVQIRTDSYPVTVNNLIEWELNVYKVSSLEYDEMQKITTIQCTSNA